MFNEEQIKNISKNIEVLGTLFKESQRDIAEAIGVGETTISNYKKGKMAPKRENLSKIAKHFNISENELINSDLSILLDLNNGNGFYSFLTSFLKNLYIIFPIIKLNEDIEDNDFENAMKLNKIFYENIEQVKENDLKKIIELYFASYDKCQNLDSYANIAMLLLILKINSKEELKDYLDIYNPFDVNDLELLTKDCILARFDDISFNEEKSNLEESEEDNILKFIDIIIDKLADSEKYKEFIYYFISLRYIFGVGVGIKELPLDICKLIGNEMMQNLVIAKNKYALNYLEKLSELLNFK